MTGFDGDDLYDGFDALGQGFLWARGVDYVGGWRQAKDAADRLNRALLGVGLELSQVRAVASTADNGDGLVQLTGLPDAVGAIARLLERVAGHEDGGV